MSVSRILRSGVNDVKRPQTLWWISPIGIEDLRRLEALEQEKQHEAYTLRQQTMLDQARALRERLVPGEETIDSARVLDQIREERLDGLVDVR